MNALPIIIIGGGFAWLVWTTGWWGVAGIACLIVLAWAFDAVFNRAGRG